MNYLKPFCLVIAGGVMVYFGYTKVIHGEKEHSYGQESGIIGGDGHGTRKKMPGEDGSGVYVPYVAAADGMTVSVRVGYKTGLIADENPSTGYGWDAQSSDEDIVEIMTSEYKAPEQDASGATRVGASGTHYFTLKGKKVGSAKITMNYQRPWESTENKAPADHRVITVNVTEDVPMDITEDVSMDDTEDVPMDVTE